MTGHPHSRQLAQTTVETLKRAGHIVVAPGATEQVLRDLVELIDPVLAVILPKVNRSPIMGEVSSTFGDEATDEAVEELVASMREALLDSDGVEDVFAEDRVIERSIFRTLAETLRAIGAREEEEEERPPISVRLDTLGYVAAAAAKSADDDTLRDALDRAAEAAQSELKTFDERTRTAFFRPAEADPEVRLDIEAAIEEELSDLVDRGVVDLPTVVRKLPLPELPDDKRRALRRKLDELSQKHLGVALCPGSWDWSDDKTAIAVVFTPLTEPDPGVIDRATEAFRSELETVLGDLSSLEASPDDAPPAARAPAKPARREDADLAFMRRVLEAAGAMPPIEKATAQRSAPAKEETPATKKKAKPKSPAEKVATDKAAAKPKAKTKSTSEKAAPEKPARATAKRTKKET